jgi:DNA polymerase-3 subunit delta
VSSTSSPHALLLHGEESFLVDEEGGRFLARWKRDLVSDFGYEVLESAGLTVARLQDALLQAPFLDPHRVVAVRWIAPGRADALAAALGGLPDTTRFLLTVNGRLGGNSKLAKAFATLPRAKVAEFPRLKGRRLNEWAATRARQHGLSAQVAALVARASPPDLGIMDSEFQKLAAYAAGGRPLDQSAVTQLLAGGREEDVFRLTDQLLPQPSASAWRICRSLLQAGMPPTTLAYRLARHLALVLEVKTRQERGEGLSDVQSVMREHPFVVQKAYELAPATQSDRLESALRALLDYEWEVKSGQVDAELGLEVVLAKL